jgi:hypothetical protein
MPAWAYFKQRSRQSKTFQIATALVARRGAWISSPPPPKAPCSNAPNLNTHAQLPNNNKQSPSLYFNPTQHLYDTYTPRLIYWRTP